MTKGKPMILELEQRNGKGVVQSPKTVPVYVALVTS